MILPPVKPGITGKGSPSDHAVVVAKPNTDRSRKTGFSRVVTRTRRLLSIKNLLALAFYLGCVNWHPLYNAGGVNAQLDMFEKISSHAQDVFCPTQTFKVKLNDKFHVTAKLARLCELKSKEFKKNQYSPRFKELKRQIEAEKKEAIGKKIKAVVDKSGGTLSWLSRVDALLDPAAGRRRHTVLPEHADRGLSTFQ